MKKFSSGKLFLILLAMCLLCLMPIFANAEVSVADIEWETALRLGWIDETVKPDEPCGKEQFYALMNAIVKQRTGKGTEWIDWETGDPMLRLYAPRVLYEAALQMGYNAEMSAHPDGANVNDPMGMFNSTDIWLCGEQWRGVDICPDYEEFCNDNTGSLPWEDNNWRVLFPNEFCTFAAKQKCFVNEMPVIELAEDGRFRAYDAITTREAVSAAFRLYCSFGDYEKAETIYRDVQKNHSMTVQFASSALEQDVHIRLGLSSDKPIKDYMLVDSGFFNYKGQQMFDTWFATKGIDLNDEVLKIKSVNEQILAEADARRASILNAESELTIAGTIYYVSPNGNDANDGLTPETAWLSLGKVSSATVDETARLYQLDKEGFPEYYWSSEHSESEWANLNPGDAVLFERGGIYRGRLKCAPGVTYSAYGTGPKPIITSSPENGADPTKWIPVDGYDNVYRYYMPMQTCGGVVVNGNQRLWCIYPGWDGTQFIYADEPEIEMQTWFRSDSSHPFTFSDLPNMKCVSLVVPNDYNTIFGLYGEFYIRCDEGNPGEVFSTIEFMYGSNEWGEAYVTANVDTVIDNLALLYNMTGYGGNGAAIRNCEIGYIGSGVLGYSQSVDGDVLVCSVGLSGDGIAVGIEECVVENNYIHDGFQNAITVETCFDPECLVTKKGAIIRGNLCENSLGGIMVTDFVAFFNGYCYETYSNVHVEDNMVLFNNEKLGSMCTKHGEHSHTGIEFFVMDGCKNLSCIGNTVYAASEYNTGLIKINIQNDSASELIIDGNTFVQYVGHPLVAFDQRYTKNSSVDWCIEYRFDDQAEETVRSLIHDEHVQVLPIYVSSVDDQ